ncbi:hypothetical protein SAMN05443292_0762 [Halpernia frigidisoli]|uniref:Uncharacterized protein n=1 Tax=Halpernia frigidisoli TaxID=1125876 RepID=A0A1I3DXM6_9FLAO|nr:hypothetical protein SAMN05443292_0762 [Halpernia frigidisoli]
MKEKSPHILNASSNLLGFCLLIITSLKITNSDKATFLDEFAGVAGIFFTISCIFSFLAIRTNNHKQILVFESIADYLFLGALVCIFFAVGMLFLKLFP